MDNYDPVNNLLNGDDDVERESTSRIDDPLQVNKDRTFIANVTYELKREKDDDQVGVASNKSSIVNPWVFDTPYRCAWEFHDDIASDESSIVNPWVLGPTCSICCEDDRVLDVRERCRSCRTLICCECIATYLKTTPNVSKIACPTCRVSWSDWECIKFATKRTEGNYTHVEYVTHASFLRPMPETPSGSYNWSGIPLQPVRTKRGVAISQDAIDPIGMWRKRVKECLARNAASRLNNEMVKTRRRNLKKALKEIKVEIGNSVGETQVAMNSGVAQIEKIAQQSNCGIMEDADLKSSFENVRTYFVAIVDALENYAEAIGTKLTSVNETYVDRQFRCNNPTCVDGLIFVSSHGVCPKCNETHCVICESRLSVNDSDQPHQCDDDALESMQLLNDADKIRPCPSCGTKIEKGTGCDDMYCTICSIFFKWSTGAIIAKTHNPEFDDYKRRMTAGFLSREFGDIECGGLIHETYAQRLFDDGVTLSVNGYVEDNFNECMKLYYAYDVLETFNAMYLFYNACLDWKLSKNAVRSSNISDLTNAYANYAMGGKKSIEKLPTRRPCVKNPEYRWVVTWSKTESSGERGEWIVNGKRTKTIPGLYGTSVCIGDAKTYSKIYTNIDEYVGDALFDIKMLDECEEKYYDTLMTFVKCCNDVFKVFTKLALELQSLTCRSDILKYLLNADKNERAVFEECLKSVGEESSETSSSADAIKPCDTKVDSGTTTTQCDTRAVDDKMDETINRVLEKLNADNEIRVKSLVLKRDTVGLDDNEKVHMMELMGGMFATGFVLKCTKAIKDLSREYDKVDTDRLVAALHERKCRLRSDTRTQFTVLFNIFSNNKREISETYGINLLELRQTINNERTTYNFTTVNSKVLEHPIFKEVSITIGDADTYHAINSLCIDPLIPICRHQPQYDLYRSIRRSAGIRDEPVKVDDEAGCSGRNRGRNYKRMDIGTNM